MTSLSLGVRLALISSVFLHSVAAQTPSSSDLGPKVQAVHAQHDVPALGAAIVLRSGPVAWGVAGNRRAEKADPVLRSDRWHLGSCTKAMTATVCARLAEAELLDLQQEAIAGFPDLELTPHDNWKGATLLEFLQHVGGADTHVPPLVWGQLGRKEEDSRKGRDFLIRSTFEAAPLRPHGIEPTYSNTGYAIAGGLAERAAKCSFEDLMRRELFAPLNLQSAGFGPPGSRESPEPRGHVRPAGAKSWRSMRPWSPAADNPSAITPAGRVHMNLEDWGRFIAAHLRRGAGESPLLTEESFKKLHTAHDTTRFAAGWMIARRPWSKGPILVHSGSNTMWYCVAWLAPEEGFAVLATCNAGGDAASKATDAMVASLLAEARKLAEKQ